MTLISPEYARMNAELHSTKPSYGIGGYQDARKVRHVAKEFGAKSILDYGCGKATLSKKIGWFAPKVYNYDPAVPEYAARPHAQDMVVCTDVLEHIEPENLEAVLDDLRDLTHKVIYLSVATRPAKKTLSDGRNAHLIQEQIEWWMPKLKERFSVKQFWGDEREFFFVGVPRVS